MAENVERYELRTNNAMAASALSLTLAPPAPLDLSGNIAENWKRFAQRFQLYLTATGASGNDDTQKTSLLLHVIGEDALDIYNSWTWATPSDAMKLNMVLQRFEQYCIPKANVTMERFHFNRATQDSCENFDQFLTRVQRLSKKCEFGELCDSLIKDRLVIGINDDNTREHLLRTDNLDLEKAIQLCKAAELVKQRSMELKSESVNVDAVHKGNRGKSRTSHQSRDQWTKQPAAPRTTNMAARQQQSRLYMAPTETHNCQRCGTWHQSGDCRAYGKRCRTCGVTGHFAKFCRSARVNTVEYDQVPVNEPQADDSDSEFLLNTVTVDSIDNNGDDWISPVLVNNVVIPMKLDTGAQTNILSEMDYKCLYNRPKLHPTQQRLKGFYNGNIPVIGKCVATILHRNQSHRLSFFVVPGGVHSLLGRAACERLNLIRLVHVVDIQRPDTDVHSSGTNNTPGTYEELKESYSDVFKGLGCLPGEHTIVVDKNVTPVVHACRKIPFALRDKVKAELDRMEKLGVISKVDEPTEWVSSLVVVTKRNGSLRLCLDPRDLNQAVKRQHYKLPTREEIMSQFAGATVFSKLDASQGFWQLKLDEPSSYLCTFNAPFGRYRYRRLPFGISSAPEVYHKTIHDIVAHIPNVDTIADDIIVWGHTNHEHDESLKGVLDAARKHNLRLNKEKCEFGVKQLMFIGDVISAEGVKPDMNKVSAIQNMPKPANKDEVRRFLGMVTYLAKWIPDLADKSAPLRKLLQDKNEWQWGPEHDRSWMILRNILGTEPVLQFFDPNSDIRVSSDASKDGLGAVLLQRKRVDDSDKWQPVAYASRTLSSSEARYAQIEKELLGIVFACERFHQYIYGATAQVETDHKPLVSIFQKALNDCPLRIQRLLMRLQRYDLAVSYTPGKYLVAADALSRAPEKMTWQSSTMEQVPLYVNMVVQSLPVTDQRLTQIRQATIQDPSMDTLKTVILGGWPQAKQNCRKEVCPYWNVRNELSVVDDVVFRGTRIVIPIALRREILHKIHDGHMGIEKCRRRGRDVVYWPNMNRDISDMVQNCSSCMKFSPAQAKEPLQPHGQPVRAWQMVGTDLFQAAGKNYLVIIDYYSIYPEVIQLPSTSSQAVITAMKSVFARHGIPEKVLSDNGPQYSSRDFKEFAVDWGFVHQTSSPHYPRSNGMAESAVKTIKNMIRKTYESGQDYYKSLLAYRSTPLEIGLSPAQLLMNRRLKTTLPIQACQLEPQLHPNNVSARRRSQQHMKKYYDQHTKFLSPLKCGDRVRMGDPVTRLWDRGGIVQKEVAPRSYQVRMDNGPIIRRNRQHLKHFEGPPSFTGNMHLEVELPTAHEDQVPEPSSSAVVRQPSTELSTECRGVAAPISAMTPVRRSTRVRHPPPRLIETM